MNKQLSTKQAKLYRFICSRIKAERDPSFREMANHMGMASVNSITVMLAILERKGYITRSKFEARSIHPTPGRSVGGGK